jgi:hypothetical protein
MVNAQGRVRQEVTDVKVRASCCDMQWHVSCAHELIPSSALFIPATEDLAGERWQGLDDRMSSHLNAGSGQV